MSTTKENCGCEHNETHWTKLCPEHEAERKGREHEVKLDSLQWLITHYDRFPNEDNLRHVIARIKDVGSAANSRRNLVDWIKAHSADILACARKPIPARHS